MARKNLTSVSEIWKSKINFIESRSHATFILFRHLIATFPVNFTMHELRYGDLCDARATAISSVSGRATRFISSRFVSPGHDDARKSLRVPRGGTSHDASSKRILLDFMPAVAVKSYPYETLFRAED